LDVAREALSDYGTGVMLAAGMVTAQTRCRTLTDAIVVMQELADQLDVPLDALAKRVIDRTIRFDR
jgi:hypothetical protein